MKHDDMIRKQIHEAVDESLSHLDARPSLYGAIMAQTEGEQKVKRKISIGVALAMAMLLAMTAIVMFIQRRAGGKSSDLTLM